MSFIESNEAKTLLSQGYGLRCELADMLRRFGDALTADPRLATAGFPNEVRELCSDPNDLTVPSAQRAVDAMRAHMAAIGIEAKAI